MIEKYLKKVFIIFVWFFLSGSSFTDIDNSQESSGKERTMLYSLCHLYRSQAFKYLFAILHVRWLPRIFNQTTSNCQATTRWVLPPYWITILIAGWCSVSFCWFDFRFKWWFDSRFLLQQFALKKPVSFNSSQLSPLYYKRTN